MRRRSDSITECVTRWMRPSILASVCGFTSWWGAPCSLPAAPAALPPPSQGLAWRLPDWEVPVTLLQPRVPRSPSEHDRALAASHYGHAQILLRRGKNDAAWHQLARAHRLDPLSHTVLLQLIRAAYDAQRWDVAVRYALQVPHTDAVDPVVWPQLASYLTEQNRWREAIQLYEQAIAQHSAGTDTNTAPQATGPPSQEQPSPEQPTTRPDPRLVLLQFQLGRLYYLTDRAPDAVTMYRHVLAALEHPPADGTDDPLRKLLVDPPGAWAFLGESFLAAGDFATAEDLFRREIARPASQHLEPLYLARLAAAQKRHEVALQLIESYVQSADDRWGEAPYLLYWRLTQERDDPTDLAQRAQVWQVLQAALAKNPRMLEVAQHLAEEYQSAGRWADAARVWRQIEAWPELAALQVQQQDWPELANTLARVAHDFGNLEIVRSALLPLIQEPVSLPPLKTHLTADPRWNYQLAAGWLSTFSTPDKGELERFVAAYWAAPAQRDVRGINWSLDLLIAGCHETALALLDEVARHDVSSGQRGYLLYYRSLALEALNRWPESRLAAHEALSLAPDQAELAGHWAWSLHRDGLTDQAYTAYSSFVARFDNAYADAADLRDRLRGARLTLSSLALLRNELGVAESHLEAVLDEFPQDIGAMNDLSYIWADHQKNLHRVLPMVEHVVATEPNNPAYRDTLGWTLYQLGRFSEAAQELGRAVALTNPPDGIITEHWGDALWEANRQTEAHVAWQQAVERLAHAPQIAARVREKMANHPIIPLGADRNRSP